MIKRVIHHMMTIEMVVLPLDINYNGGSTYRPTQVLSLNFFISQETICICRKIAAIILGTVIC